MSSDERNVHNQHNQRHNTWIERIGHIIKGEPNDRDDLAEIISDAGEREIIDEDTQDMLEGVFEISELRVRDIMIPRSQMITISNDSTIEKATKEIIESGHSRYPVIYEDKDHIEGILLAKDLLKFLVNKPNNGTLKDIIRPAVVVPESKRVDRLLKEFQQCRYHMAIVVDEYGGVSGLVTIEDILELIVGEIEDEYDTDDEEVEDIKQISPTLYHIQSLTPIETFNKKFNTNYSDDEFDTIGGLVMHAFGHLPSKGDSVSVDQFNFKVLSADKRSTHLLQMIISELE
ncbi:MAG: HlyC/CorC family transporter [Succinivibrionaceae bacterium]